MKKSKLTDQQIAFALKQAESGTLVEELRRLKQLEEENKRLKSLVADLGLDKQILQDVLSKKLRGLPVFVNASSYRYQSTKDEQAALLHGRSY